MSDTVTPAEVDVDTVNAVRVDHRKFDMPLLRCGTSAARGVSELDSKA
jgi:hypothetical protein